MEAGLRVQAAVSPISGWHAALRRNRSFWSYLVGDFACIVLDRELRKRHLGFGVQWVGAVVVMALLQKCMVRGLKSKEDQ